MSRLALAFVLGFVFAFSYVSVSDAAVITCTGGTCNGTDNVDQITGSGLRDDIYGKGGGDQITVPTSGFGCSVFFSGDTEVHFCFPDSKQTVHGGGGADTIIDTEGYPCPEGYGCAGDRDTLYGGDGDDTIDVRDGYDGSTFDTIDCGGGTDTAYVDTGDVVTNCEHVIRVP